MSGYTPGPWAIKAYEDERFVEIKASNGYRVVASVPFNNGDRDANARLIASAPDLLEALQLVLPKLAHKASCLSVRPTSEWEEFGSMSSANCDCAIKVVSAAISSATGEGE